MNHFLKTGRRKRRVLIVDDELINRELLETILGMNYDVTSVSNGMDAMSTLRAESGAFSLILLDIIMPGMSGFDVIQACKSDDMLKEIPIIVMTSEKSAEVRSIRMGAADFIAKPYRMPEVILARCERIVEQNEERQLIRSIETEPVTGLYVKLFFDAYLKRYAPNVKGAMDAVAIRIDGLESVPEHHRDALLKKAADLMNELIVGRKGIGCRADETAFLCYCRHKENYEELLGKLISELSSVPGAEGVSFRAGICVKPDVSTAPDAWFVQATDACDSLAVNGGRLAAVCS